MSTRDSALFNQLLLQLLLSSVTSPTSIILYIRNSFHVDKYYKQDNAVYSWNATQGLIFDSLKCLYIYEQILLK
jgi:hypothetical protein